MIKKNVDNQHITYLVLINNYVVIIGANKTQVLTFKDIY